MKQTVLKMKKIFTSDRHTSIALMPILSLLHYTASAGLTHAMVKAAASLCDLMTVPEIFCAPHSERCMTKFIQTLTKHWNYSDNHP